MSPSAPDVVTLGADVGGKDAHVATREHVLAFRKLLQQQCQGPYSATIKEFALVLRIDGSIQSWCKSGVENVMLQQGNTYATADIFVPREVWSGGTSSSLRHFLAVEVRSALIRIAELAQQRKITVSIDKLSHDIDAAVEEFVA